MSEREVNFIFLQSFTEPPFYDFWTNCKSMNAQILRDNNHLRGGLIFVIAKIWSQDTRHTIKSCAGVLIIGTTVAAAMMVIRLVGEPRLQRFLNRLISFKGNTKVEKLADNTFVPDNQP
jgi:hypothetical protein